VESVLANRVTRLGEFRPKYFVFFGQFFENYGSVPHLYATFPHTNNFVSILTKNKQLG
jgi:hypothetical protein